MLVERGADVNVRTKARSDQYGATAWLREPGATPLLRAAYCADLEVIKYLLAHGADPQIATTDGTTTLMGWSALVTATASPRTSARPTTRSRR
jgi:hypothetical protein